jgi:hypothetical protein
VKIRGSLHKKLEHLYDQLPKYHIKLLLGNVNTKVRRKYIFKSTIRNEGLHEICNDSGDRVVNFATSKNLS